MSLTVGSLFAGIGGFDLGLENTGGFTTQWQVEIDPYCNRVLAKHWPTIPRYGDIRTMDWGTVEPVDVLCGGFPCQDLSFAGKRAGIDGARSGLWSEYLRAIVSLRPRYVLVENVPGLLTNAYMGRVLGDLAESGYDAEWDCISASSIGALHQRDRVWIVAYPAEVRWERDKLSNLRHESVNERIQSKPSGGSAVGQNTNVADSQEIRNSQRIISFAGAQQAIRIDQYGKQSRRVAITDYWEAEPTMGRVVDGVSSRVDRLAGLGNAIVPQIAEALGRMIMRHEEARKTARVFHTKEAV